MAVMEPAGELSKADSSVRSGQRESAFCIFEKLDGGEYTVYMECMSGRLSRFCPDGVQDVCTQAEDHRRTEERIMANIFDYLEWRCDMPFSVDPFNEVDNLVLAELVYTDFKGIVSMDGREVSLREACEAFFRHHTHEEIMADKSFTARAPLLMEKMLCGTRYRDLRMCWFLDETDSFREVQIAVITFLLPDQSAYIAFRGTDGTLVGWKEDFNLSFLPETEGQSRAVRYLNQVGRLVQGTVRVGGHSKGGNLAVYAAAGCDREVQDRIETVYSNDGPGFQKEMLSSDGYQRILPKIASIVPDTSIIGLLLSSPASQHVIKSSQTGILQHDGFSWEVARNRFVTAELSDLSLLIKKSLSDWLNQMSDENRRVLTEVIFSLIESTGADTFSEISQQKWKSAEAMMAAIRKVPKEKQAEILSFLQQLGLSGGQTLTEYISARIRKEQ